MLGFNLDQVSDLFKVKNRIISCKIIGDSFHVPHTVEYRLRSHEGSLTTSVVLAIMGAVTAGISFIHRKGMIKACK